MTNDYSKSAFEDIEYFEKDIGIQKGFFNNLLKEDDWSFIIKLHSLFEAAVTHLLTKALERDELEDVISNLALSDMKTGKLGFVKSLKLLSKEERTFIHSLSELRNMLVHNISNINFNLINYVNDGNNLKKFIKSFGFSIAEKPTFNNRKVDRNEFIKYSPKVTIWLGAFACLNSIYKTKRIAESSNPLLRLSLRAKS
jgi:hypothetical protein